MSAAFLIPLLASASFGKGGRIYGRVVDGETGAPISGYRVTMTARATGTYRFYPSAAFVDGFVLDGLPADTHQVTISATGFANVTVAVELAAFEAREIRVELGTNGTTLEGTIDDRGHPLDGAELTLMPVRISEGRERLEDFVGFASAITENGRFSMRGVAPGRYRVEATTSITSDRELDLGEISVPSAGKLHLTLPPHAGEVSVEIPNWPRGEVDIEIAAGKTLGDDLDVVDSAAPASPRKVRFRRLAPDVYTVGVYFEDPATGEDCVEARTVDLRRSSTANLTVVLPEPCVRAE